MLVFLNDNSNEPMKNNSKIKKTSNVTAYVFLSKYFGSWEKMLVSFVNSEKDINVCDCFTRKKLGIKLNLLMELVGLKRI